MGGRKRGSKRDAALVCVEDEDEDEDEETRGMLW